MAIHYNSKISTDGLVLCLDAANSKSYPGSGTTWTDLSGNGNNGTLVNGVGYNSGNLGSLVFDGVDDYVNTTNIQFDRTDAFTLSSWIYVLSGNSQIINNEDTSYRGYQFVFNTSNRLQLFLRNAVSSNFIGITSNDTITLNNWIFVSGTYNGNSDASGLKLYANGVEINYSVDGNNLTETTISNQTTWIGRRRPTTNGPFNGNISQVSIYNRALTASEIQQNFNATRSRYGI